MYVYNFFAIHLYLSVQVSKDQQVCPNVSYDMKFLGGRDIFLYQIRLLLHLSCSIFTTTIILIPNQSHRLNEFRRLC